MFNSFLDKSILFSFDQTGYHRHAKYFSELSTNFTGKSFLVTGGTSGIGQAVAQFLSDQGAIVHVVGRSPSKFQMKQERVYFHQLDMQKWDDFQTLIQTIPVLHGLIMNAGAMPASFMLNDYGYESQVASQLFGHYVFFKLCESILVKKAKVIFVSSGGMYLKNFNYDELLQTNAQSYDKVATYANVKRAQVMLCESLSQIEKRYQFASMHPGWVDTYAVRSALPKFHSLLGKNLRTPKQGADTINFLLQDSITLNGEFWFDRQIRQTGNLFFGHTDVQREKLYSLVEHVYKEFKANLKD